MSKKTKPEQEEALFSSTPEPAKADWFSAQVDASETKFQDEQKAREAAAREPEPLPPPPVLEKLSDYAGVAADVGEAKFQTVLGAKVRRTEVQLLIEAAAGLVDALATRCTGGQSCGLAELRQLERDVRALAP